VKDVRSSASTIIVSTAMKPPNAKANAPRVTRNGGGPARRYTQRQGRHSCLLDQLRGALGRFPLLGRSALQLIENQFAMLLECAEALFERKEHRLRHP
jgi:hypothetical protein